MAWAGVAWAGVAWAVVARAGVAWAGVGGIRGRRTHGMTSWVLISGKWVLHNLISGSIRSCGVKRMMNGW